MKILVISLAGVGDTLMATPLISELRKNFPYAIIDCLVMWKSSKQILENNSNLNRVFYFNMIKRGFIKTLLFCKKLKMKRYDISINSFPQGKIYYRLVPRLINAKIRLSHKYSGEMNFLDKFLINKSIKPDYSKHCIENNLNFLNLLNKGKKLKEYNYEIYFSENEEESANNFIKEKNLEGKILIGYHIGSGSTKNLALRRWPKENYIKLSKKLLQADKKIAILLFGAKEEEKINQEISSVNPKRIIIVKKENIKESAAIIKKCKIFLSVDTSLMHIASAVKVKNQLVIETPTFNETVYPYNKNFINIKNPALIKNKLEYYKYDGGPINLKDKEIIKIMGGIKVEAVFNIIKDLIKKSG